MTTNPITMRDPGEIVAALPIMLGYYPHESLVVMCLHDRRLGITMRYDLNQLCDIELAADIAQRVIIDSPTKVILLTYTEQPDADEELPFEPLRRLVEAGIDDYEIMDTLVVRGGQWYCASGCCPTSEGRPIQGNAEYEAVMVGRGVNVLDTRQSLTDELAYDGSGDFDPTQQVNDPVAHFTALASRRANGDPIADDELDALVNACRDGNVHVRDRILCALTDKEARPHMVSVLADALRRTPTEFAAAIASVTAWGAYANGDGTRANIALERALACDSNYSLANLIGVGLQNQIPPAALEQVMLEATKDLASP